MLRAINNPTKKNKTVRNFYLTGYTSKGTFNRRFLLPQKWRHLVDAPFKISDRCCDILKKNPGKEYEKESGKHPFVGELAEESLSRTESYLTTGCNAFDLKSPKSTPLAFWTEQDILRYIRMHRLKIATVYGEIVERDGKLVLTGEQRTGCVWCMFGAEYPGADGLNRFQRLALTHPRIWMYCIESMGLGRILDIVGVDYMPPADPLVKLGKGASTPTGEGGGTGGAS